MFILFLYIITIVGAISSVTPTNAYPFAQVIPVPISPGTLGSSSINWWPYTNVAVTSNAIIVSSMVQTPMLMPSPTTTTTATSSLPSSIYSSTTINTITRTINSTTSGTTSSTSSLIQVSPSSSSSSSPTSTSAGGTPRPGFKIAYLFPVSVLLGAILGASFVAVCFRRWRQRYKEDSPSRHPWPADGGFIPVTDHRDEEEKKWTAERRSHSEEKYETDISHQELANVPTVLQQFFKKTIKSL
ncbi:hypothetical protein FRC18_010668 [Serendipita sp. 400]|nr:hypothetical protein FRC18_010668 [Serendipita sp. 400]